MTPFSSLSPTVTPTSLSSVHGPTALRGIVDYLTDDRQVVNGWLRTIHDERADDVARRSYWHPNGFAKLVLQARRDYKVRLHVWPAGDCRRGDTNPHGHRWNFASTVLCGDGLHEIHYVEACSGDAYERYRYAGGNVAGALTHEGNVRLVKREERDVHAGDRYELDTRVVHTVHPLGNTLVATLVVQSAPLHASARVYGIPGVNVDEPGQAISVEEVRELITDVLDAQGS